MLRWKLLAIAICTSAALYATTAAAEILIGVAGPMTGKDAWFGEQMERGAALQVCGVRGGRFRPGRQRT